MPGSKRTTRSLPVLVLLLLLPLPLGAQSRKTPGPEALEGLSPVQAMEVANAWARQHPEIASFVTPQKIHFRFPDGTPAAIRLPEDRMVVAVAPYVTHTHNCTTHTMSGCQGELVEVPLRITAFDRSGAVILDETRSTLANGFLELWLPRDREILLSLESGGRRASGSVATYAGSNTCITTFRLR